MHYEPCPPAQTPLHMSDIDPYMKCCQLNNLHRTLHERQLPHLCALHGDPHPQHVEWCVILSALQQPPVQASSSASVCASRDWVRADSCLAVLIPGQRRHGCQQASQAAGTCRRISICYANELTRVRTAQLTLQGVGFSDLMRSHVVLLIVARCISPRPTTACFLVIGRALTSSLLAYWAPPGLASALEQ